MYMLYQIKTHSASIIVLYFLCVVHYKTNCTIDKVLKVSTINVLHIYKLTKKNDKSPSVKQNISDSVYIPLRFLKRMYTLYNTARCVNTAWYINLGLHRVNIHIHMFPMSHTLSKSVNISQRYVQQGKLDAFERIFGCGIYTRWSGRFELTCIT
jgi:hypothetical protein